MENILAKPHMAVRPSLIRRLHDMLSLRGQRRRLRDLSDHLLDDIGVSALDARQEAHRPIWDVPEHWKR